MAADTFAGLTEFRAITPVVSGRAVNVDIDALAAGTESDSVHAEAGHDIHEDDCAPCLDPRRGVG